MSFIKRILKNHFEGGANLSQGGTSKDGESLADLVRALEAEGQMLVLPSDPGAGGGATEAMVVTGLRTTDTIMAVTQRVKGANSLPLLGFNTQAANALTGVWSADPGAGAEIDVLVKRVPLA